MWARELWSAFLGSALSARVCLLLPCALCAKRERGSRCSPRDLLLRRRRARADDNTAHDTAHSARHSTRHSTQHTAQHTTTTTITQRTDEVGVEHAAQQLLALRERAEDLARGKGAVQKHAAADLVEALAQQRRQDQEVVVVDPHSVGVGRALLDDLFEERLVRLDVALPQLGVEARRAGRRHRQQVVEQRPQLLLAEAFFGVFLGCVWVVCV